MAKQKWPQKIIEATWHRVQRQTPAIVALRVFTSEDRVGLLRDITSAISSAKINIISCHANAVNGEITQVISLKLEVSSIEDLEKVFLRLKQIEGVKAVKRI